MHFKEPSLDKILYKVYTALLENQVSLGAERDRIVGELIGAQIVLTNPLARISRSESRSKPLSAIGELIWYLSKSDDLDFIKYYIPRYIDESDDHKTIYGAYGPRIFNKNGSYNQFETIIRILSKRPDSKKAVIQLFDAADLTEPHKTIPCTCTLQFLIRANKLILIAHMRSNDAYYGLPHDIFTFTMLQEIISRTLGVELGNYIHMVGSLHLYDKQANKVKSYLNEGMRKSNLFMPEMPVGNPIDYIKQLLSIEKMIRLDKHVDINNLNLPDYWSDLSYLLLLFKYRNDIKTIRKIKTLIKHEFYEFYINDRILKNS